MAASAGLLDSSASPSASSNGNGLLLYQNYASYYSQKVVMALHEKKLKYKSHIIHLLRYEQYQPWFMRLNPKGQVPVLMDGVKIIPDSARIIDYLEDNFSNGNTPKLWPAKGSEQLTKMRHFCEVLANFPVDTITIGCIKFKELTQDMKIPSFMQKALLSSSTKCVEMLDSLTHKYPEFSEHYLHKKNRMWQRSPEHQRLDDVKLQLNDLEVVLDEVEEELVSHVDEYSEWWLCCDCFTVADITLTVLLNRLSHLGLGHRFWGEGRRPHLAAYFRRVQVKESFLKTFVQMPPRIVQFLACLDVLLDKASSPVLLVGLTSVAVVAAIYVYKCRN